MTLLALCLGLAACSADSTDQGENPLGNTAGTDPGVAGSVATAGSGSGVTAGSSSAGTGGTTAPQAGSGTTGTAGTAAVSGTGGSSTGTSGTSGSNAGTSGTGGSGTSGTGGNTGPAPNIERVDNPFANAKGYVNPEWRAKAMGESGGERVANTPTAVWLDRIAAIEGTPDSVSNGPMGLRDHLDAALEQGAGYIQIVIYDLPGRDCAALASNGELSPTDLPRYKAEYIDPIASIMGDAKYAGLRIVTIIEPDSLPNLVTNTNVAKCAQMKENGAYVQGVAYALMKLGALKNVYNYVDAGHHGWLGWDTNVGPTAMLFAQTAQMAGMNTVAGFITNTANYSALREPHFNTTTMVSGTTVRQAKWVDWNQYVDELGYAQGLRTMLVSAGFDSAIGMLIDTSRNGWGGSARPSAPSASTNVDTFVNESRVDRRVHAGNWCNQSGAGIGERPRANPETGIDAYVWIKPPGESDGASTDIPNDEGKSFDRMCDPTYGGNERNGNSTAGSLGDAPLAGAWFAEQFRQLVQNAHPPL